jgi:aryl-alcohol dehydrogenase-like predicted oxidoreductase
MATMERRRFGRTDEKLSIVGFGGILVMNEDQPTANMMVREAIERGINYFDVAPSYGNAEERLGPALEPYRDSVFLACKTGERTREGAMAELHQSLQRLRTDHLDLYQLHAVTTLEEVERIMGSGGAMEAFIEAREKGIIKYIGFSAHSEEAALALLDRFDFDSILFPLNWVCWYRSNFGPKVVDVALKKGVAILALKALAKRKWKKDEVKRWTKCWYAPVDTAEEASLALRFTLSLPVTAAVSPGHIEFLRWACDTAEKFSPLTDEEREILVDRSKDLEPIFP